MRSLISAMLSFAFMTCVFSGSLSLLDDEEDDLDYFNLSLEDLMKLTVTSASKMAEKPSEAPSAIVLIKRQQIQAYGWESLNEVLYHQAGFGPGQDYERETVPSRGLFDSWSANHLLHLVDGIPMNDNLYGTAYTWEITPLFLANEVEIIRGPGSALYGSNATNGVVQVNTVSAKDLAKNVMFRAEHGSFDTEVYDLLAGVDLDKLGWTVGYQTRNTDGYAYDSADGSGRLDESGDPQTFQVRDERSSSYLWSKFQFKGALDGLTVQLHEQKWGFQTGHGWLFWVPDRKESMHEQRRIISAKYSHDSSTRFSQEYVLRHQRHDLRWRQRYYPNSAFDDYYPTGMWEVLDSGASDLFLRAQVAYQFDHGNLLAGLEGTRFTYEGDNEHTSNINVDSPFFEPFPENRDTTLGPWLDFILDHPIVNQALFVQYSSGDLFDHLRLTAGVRYDRMDLTYDRIYEPGRPEAKRRFSRTSPRLSLVYIPSERLSLKLMAGQAFRAPSPTELAGAHTFSLASNIETLEPELLDTVEAALDWRFLEHYQLRANLFRTRFENQIAYSTQNNNLSTNVFTQTSSGLELEFLTRHGKWNSFINFASSRRDSETVLDETIAESADDLVWNPDLKLNAGLSYVDRALTVSLSGHYQSAVARRASEVGIQELPLGVGVSLDLDASRPTEVAAWTALDLNLQYRLGSSLELGLQTRNAFDKEYALIKTGPFPFDYRQPGRTVQANLKLTF